MDGRNRNGPGPKGRADRDVLKPDETWLVASYSDSLWSFLQEVSAAMAELRQEVPGLTLSTKKTPDEILALLPQFLEFEQMSLLEVQYVLPEISKRPGIRFWLEGPRTGKRLRAVLFSDTVIWDVSYSLEKLYTELGTFSLGDGDIVACTAPPLSGKPGSNSDWKSFLRAVLRSPIPCPMAKGRTEDV